MGFRIHLYLSGILILILLSSCLTVEADLNIRQDGGGTLFLNYTLDKRFTGIQKDGSTSRTLIPLPVNLDDFSMRAAAQEGLGVRSLNGQEGLETLSVVSDLNFSSILSLRGVTGIPLEYEQNGNITTLRILFLQQDQRVPSESLRLIGASVLDNLIDIRIEVPGLIRSSSIGDVAADNRSVRYTGNVEELFQGSDFIWEIRWIGR